jgi:hypothetical protein
VGFEVVASEETDDTTPGQTPSVSSLSPGHLLEDEKTVFGSSFREPQEDRRIEKIPIENLPEERRMLSAKGVIRQGESTSGKPPLEEIGEPLVVRPRSMRYSAPEMEQGAAQGQGRPAESLSRSTVQGSTIRVTIGRIEVRAVMQQPPIPERAATPIPGLSLDDYLRSRDGGKT